MVEIHYFSEYGIVEVAQAESDDATEIEDPTSTYGTNEDTETDETAGSTEDDESEDLVAAGTDGLEKALP